MYSHNTMVSDFVINELLFTFLLIVLNLGYPFSRHFTPNCSAQQIHHQMNVSQIHLLQQLQQQSCYLSTGRSMTSLGLPALYSSPPITPNVNIVAIATTVQTSVPLYSVAPQPATFHNPVTTVQCDSYTHNNFHDYSTSGAALFQVGPKGSFHS